MPGTLVVIEGADATGKTTQVKLLVEALKKEGKQAVSLSFPRYETFFGGLVKKYLKGEFGKLHEVKPEVAALLYSLDRFDAMPLIEDSLKKGKFVVCDRYIASNIAHQASKFPSKKRGEFISWLETVESRLPKPSLTIFLDLPVPVSAKLMQGRPQEKDIHELDLDYLEATRQVFLSLSKKPNWARIDCAEKNGAKSREAIHEIVWQKVEKLL